MTPDEIDARLRETLDDRRLSRAERKALREVFGGLAGEAARAAAGLRAFAVARAALADPADAAVLDWLEEVVRLLLRPAEPGSGAATADIAEAYFSPADDGPRRIAGLVAGARRMVEVCVFTITDDRISDAILDAHRRGVAVRVISDDEKALDPGSDIERLRQAGVPVRLDRSAFHMHHKFALFDGALLLTGSYNWTRGAAQNNQDNFLVVGDPRLVSAFARTFEQLWERLA